MAIATLDQTGIDKSKAYVLNNDIDFKTTVEDRSILSVESIYNIAKTICSLINKNMKKGVYVKDLRTICTFLYR
ncbi:MAG: hypothetical protein HRT40_13300 [Campylobacteraceae bacterium]|nr:hypothetical protein [Campylobacteraceae bacterium]